MRRGAFRREFESSYRGGAGAARRVRAAACRPHVRAGRGTADDRPPPHRNLPRADQRAEASAARRAVGRHDARRDQGTDGRHPAGARPQQGAHDHHRRTRDGRDRAHHRPLRRAQLRPQDRRGPVSRRSPPTRRCRKPISGWRDERRAEDRRADDRLRQGQRAGRRVA